MTVVFLIFIKKARTDPMSVLKQTALNLSCFWALCLMPHRPDGQIGSLQTSCLHKLCVQLACSVTAFSGYYPKIGCLEEDESSTADFLQQYCRKLAVFLISREIIFPWAPFVNHIILIPVAILGSSNAGSFSLKYKEGSKRQCSGIQMYVTYMLNFCISTLKRMVRFMSIYLWAILPPLLSLHFERKDSKY